MCGMNWWSFVVCAISYGYIVYPCVQVKTVHRTSVSDSCQLCEAIVSFMAVISANW